MNPGLLDFLDAPSERVALVDAATGATWTYRDLAAAVRRRAAGLAAPRNGLVLCPCRPGPGTIVGYLAARAAGHAVLLAENDPARITDLTDRYRPEFVLGDRQDVRADPAGPVHPGLAVLLCTSGSTGSPKSARLSVANVDASATQIADFLELDRGDRAIQSLPWHYCYGLSVLNSHLLAGASVVLTSESPARRAFWDAAREHGCTSFAGVPHAYRILDTIGLDDIAPSTLRTLTVAGGRLAPDRVVDRARWIRRRGGRMFVMYGQTEATARIAYVPPERVLDAPDAIGLPVPGGRLWVSDDDELHYAGPNVMMGYATCRADLARGDELGGVLATGDLGRRGADGLFRITGRRSRFAKICGRRFSLDDVEAQSGLADSVAVEVAGHLVLAHAGAQDSARVARDLAFRLGLPASLLRVCEVDTIPRSPTGKPDYRRLTALLDRGGPG